MAFQDGFEFIQVVTTTDTEVEARKIAVYLVEKTLAACVQVSGPVLSTYFWQGKTETSTEWQCKIKTLKRSYKAVEAAIKELHSYEVPQVIALPVVDVAPEYAEWLRDALSS